MINSHRRRRLIRWGDSHARSYADANVYPAANADADAASDPSAHSVAYTAAWSYAAAFTSADSSSTKSAAAMTPSTTRRIDYVILALTVLAALPYELGPVATIIPAAAKPWVALTGIVSKLILSEMKVRQTANKEDL